MTTLCKVLHHNTSDLLPVNDIAKLKKFAAVADKYDCIQPSAFFGRIWLERIGCETKELVDILILARDSDDHQNFHKPSKLMADGMSVAHIVQEFRKAKSRLPIEIYGKFTKIYY